MLFYPNRWAKRLRQFVSITHTRQGADTHSSGIRGVREWFTNDTNISRTLSTLHVLTAELSRSFYNGTVIAIELINEPFPYTTSELNILKSYYQAGYETVRSNDGACKVVVAIDEGFQGLQTWEAFMQKPSYNNVAVDTVSRIFESLGANESAYIHNVGVGGSEIYS